MLEIILAKMGFESVEAYFESEKKIAEKYQGCQIDRITPLSKLTFDEIEWFRNYCVENSLV